MVHGRWLMAAAAPAEHCVPPSTIDHRPSTLNGCHMLRRVPLILLLSATAVAQTFPAPSYFQRFFVKPNTALQLPGPASLDNYVLDGKLRLSLADAIELTLANNTDIKLNQLQTDLARNALRKAYAPFDPVLTASFNPSRSTSPSTPRLPGASTLSTLNQNFQSSYSPRFQSGTLYETSLSTSRSATN